MAKEREGNRSITEELDDEHAEGVERLMGGVHRRIDEATEAVCHIASIEAHHKGEDVPFSATTYPQTRNAIHRETEKLVRDLTVMTLMGTRQSWMKANHKVDTILRDLAKRSGLDLSDLKTSGDRNLEGLTAFQERKTNGLGLSDHIWRVGAQYREQVSLAVDVALTKGRSAQELSRDVRGLLNDPDRLFRRVRDKKGNLVPSRAMKAFHPPKGEYKSSYKNAMRLARTEINMAYRMADMQRWEKMDSVLGFEVRRSDKERRQVKGKGGKVILMDCPLCDQLKGKYPKGFKFVGWHPQCLCYCIPILKGSEGNPEEVTDVPEGFKEWVSERIADQERGKRLWAKPPYFVRDNFKDGDLSKGLSLSRDNATIQTEVKPSIKKTILDGEMYHKVDTKKYGDRFQISIKADRSDLDDNKRVARALLDSFPDVQVKIRPHIRTKGHKNPELEINGLIADNKRIQSEKGVKNAYQKAISQGCKSVVIDLDAEMKRLPINAIAKGISWRADDFLYKGFTECYVIYENKAIRIDKSIFQKYQKEYEDNRNRYIALEKIKADLKEVLRQLKPQRGS